MFMGDEASWARQPCYAGAASVDPCSGRRGRERLVDVPEDVVDVLEADRDADHVGLDAGGELLCLVELAMRRRGRMDDERAGIADVGEVAHELRRLDELHAGRQAAL